MVHHDPFRNPPNKELRESSANDNQYCRFGSIVAPEWARSESRMAPADIILTNGKLRVTFRLLN